MSALPTAQRNPYKGLPPRAWVRTRFRRPDGTVAELDLVADTGNPFAVVLGSSWMAQLNHRALPDRNSNFGLMQGGWLLLNMPELALDHFVPGYGSDDVMVSTRASSPDFEGLVGLPLLRLLEYGGNSAAFWIRRP